MSSLNTVKHHSYLAAVWSIQHCQEGGKAWCQAVEALLIQTLQRLPALLTIPEEQPQQLQVAQRVVLLNSTF